MSQFFKNNILKIALLVGGIIFLVTPALAATTFSFSPPSISITAGGSYTLKVMVHPHGIKNYTAMAQIQYPADLLEIKTFNFGNGWTALSQPGYDLVDNKNGLLIKTAGYPGGISDSVIFGTIFFAAKKAGDGMIQVSENSLVFDAANQNVFTGPLARIVISKIVTVPGTVSAPKEKVSESPTQIQKEKTLGEQETAAVGENTITEPEFNLMPTEEEIFPETEKEKPALFDIAVEPGVQETNASRLKFVGLAVFVILLLTAAGYILYKKKRSS